MVGSTPLSGPSSNRNRIGLRLQSLCRDPRGKPPAETVGNADGDALTTIAHLGRPPGQVPANGAYQPPLVLSQRQSSARLSNTTRLTSRVSGL